VIQEFGRRFADLIPSEHYEENASGNIKWEWAVRWSRQDLFDSGLMGSEGTGIWTITDQGRKWLDQYPDGDGQKLLELIYQQKKLMSGRKKLTTNPIRETTRDTSRKIVQGGDRTIDIAHSILDNQIKQVRNFLDGRSALRPADEQLCDWVQFCYTFGLYNEGWEIFKYIDQEKVEPWHYRRTKRYGLVCKTKLR
jgi:hypothetical protein